MSRFRYLVLIPLLAAAVAPATASWLNNPDNSFEVRLATEMGFVGVLAHTIQFGQQGTKFDYVADGGQDVLFPFRRMTVRSARRPRTLSSRPARETSNVFVQTGPIFSGLSSGDSR